MPSELKLSDFDYNLPKELIAKFPSEERDKSKLLVLHRNTGKIEHRIFRDIVDYLGEGDVLIINKTKVIPARIKGLKETGGKIEVLILGYGAGGIVPALLKPSKNLRVGTRILLGEEYCEIAGIEDGIIKLKFSDDVDAILKKHGRIPLPPYIRRELIPSDTHRYQTVFADVKGSVAAPTAGLHFTKKILEKIQRADVKIADLLLHISWGTFSPVRCENIAEHRMGMEHFEIGKASADIINSAKRTIAVGTTSLRVLETVSDERKIIPQKGTTDIFIYPGYKFKSVDALVTNFHLPKTTLLMLVSAFACCAKDSEWRAGRDLILNAYEKAKRNKYRFASYGDAMLIL